MINVSLDLYKTFYMVAKLKSMTLAADELMVSQPAVSKSIKTLILNSISSIDLLNSIASASIV